MVEGCTGANDLCFARLVVGGRLHIGGGSCAYYFECEGLRKTHTEVRALLESGEPFHTTICKSCLVTLGIVW